MNARSLTLAWLIGLSVGWSAHAQSTFLLQNLRPPFVDAPVFDAEGVPLAGPNYLAELWGGPSPDALAPAVLFDRNQRYIVQFIRDGYFFSTKGFLAVLDVPPGGFAWLQVRAWDARLGATYEEVEARGLGGYGESPVFYADGGNPLLALPELPGLLIGLESFRLRPVIPEPTTWALAVLGSALVVAGRCLRGRSKRRRHASTKTE